jgi:hypothetical protein
VLVRNPALADHLLSLVVDRSLPPVTSWADPHHQERLNAVFGRADHYKGVATPRR